MSLDFSVERMKNYNVLTTVVYPATEKTEEQRKWHPVTNGLIWATMAVGMNEITEANWREFYNRLNMWERTAGPQLWRGDIPKDSPDNYITPLEVFMHIGLHTNASKKTDAQFLKDCYSTLKEGNSFKTKDTEVDYMGLSLDDITEEDWQRAWRQEGIRPLNTDTLVAKIRNPDHPVGELGPTEQITSTSN